MPNLYAATQHTHVALVVLSVVLFALRWVGVLANARWPLQRRARMLSMGIDTALLAAGATLWWWLQIHPLHQHWLGAKLVLLVVYIVLGSFALKRARRWWGKLLFGLLALAVVAQMVAIAQTRNPLGWLGL
ncbi:MAG: SirB2 family protein [Hydrogenophaga sp.]|jgi:uncharacterized membrane protein SirB2|nr:SirB2 family protein [Hydrogenophaga sp.]